MTWDCHINNVVNRSLKSLTYLKQISFKIPRLVKQQMYLSYVCPLLEYGAKLYYSCTKKNRNSLEAVQRQFCLVITGAYKVTKYEMLLKECTLESLQSIWKAKDIVLMYKIVHEISPTYLQDILPKPNSVQYSIRNNRNIQQFLCKRDFFYKSFFPSSFRLWNNLNSSIRNIQMSLNQN